MWMLTLIPQVSSSFFAVNRWTKKDEKRQKKTKKDEKRRKRTKKDDETCGGGGPQLGTKKGQNEVLGLFLALSTLDFADAAYFG